MQVDSQLRLENAVKEGICVGCGACVALDSKSLSLMEYDDYGPVPRFEEDSVLASFVEKACPALGIDYPELYQFHYKRYPENWLTGHSEKVRTGYSANPEIRSIGASGGVLTNTLLYLLQNGLVDAVIHAKQGIPTPESARYVVSRTEEDILAGAQSIYIPVSMLDSLQDLEPGKRYAIVCLPDQAASLRVMQQHGFPQAMQIKYVLGPFTGTALYPSAIRCYLRSKRVKDSDGITSLKWRAGEWPGYLEVKTESGRVVRTPKVYYNFLIPFFVTRASLQSMDFANEFADLAVGDAWSPVHESEGGGHSVVVTRSQEMEHIISDMVEKGYLSLQEEELLKASEMHGHMIDFKKRGSWLRNNWRIKTGRMAPDFGYRPARIPFSRVFVEIVISGIFAIGRTRMARWLVSRIPESILGPLFDKSRLGWKKASRPTKRKGLSNFEVVIGQ